ncbi:MAG: hypothetical protein PHH13_03475 [Candidatus Peribacteraceae bacterium]|nr:hypothetical protein [Candidatus Peribacteraceae bacterium]
MDIAVHTGHTKTASGVSLVSLALKSGKGEQVALLLQIHAAPQEAKTLEKEYVSIVEHALLETEGDAANRLDSALKELNGLLKGLLVSQTVEDIHAIVAIVGSNGTLHVSHAGRAEAYIVRAGAASQITEYTRGKATPAFVHIASGELEARDVVVLSTQRLLRTVTPAQLAQISARGDQMLDELKMALEAEKERAALTILHVEDRRMRDALPSKPLPPRAMRQRGAKWSRSFAIGPVFSSLGARLGDLWEKITSSRWLGTARMAPTKILSDLKDPKRRKKAHLLLLAGAVATFLVVWAIVNIATSNQRSSTSAELEQLVSQIDSDIRTAENRRLTGDIDSANAILQRAEEQAKRVMDNESGLYRTETLDLIERIRQKSEEINNIVRIPPRVVANLAAKKADISASGLIGLKDGELVVYDRQDLYRILLNSVDEPTRLSDEELILNGNYFARMQSLLFQTTANSIIEVINGQPSTMKTEDPAGWITGKSIKTYLRFLYILSPENNQIYKYERLSNRYAAPAEYNVNGDLAGAMDIALDGNIYVLKEGGQIVKLLRGETQPYVIRHLPENALKTAVKVFKIMDSNIYFLDPAGSRVIVATDGGKTGEASYIRQFVLQGDQVGMLKDLYVDPEEQRLYVMDEKRVYSIDLGTK